eukprot:CAMPEP_0181295584 /NCGR_PEP_ID=MMETSP1101-20121128/4227_1 /TAXON_ID=46948 /ORGANISM="Rhodomonas abbreviata, Strain Caron Lab Isolate" /LENGTH=430 /DNA_ID=CAMNT_0023400349 /DNA_START=74 /DNA_END=1363 /DNA_ORIENTATION=+
MPARRRRSSGASPSRLRSPSPARSRSGSSMDDSTLISSVDESGGHDKYSLFFYRPHFLLALVAGYGGLFYTAMSSDSLNSSQTSNVKRGLVGVIFSFLLYCSLPTPVPKSLFTRPHPIVWRIVLGFAILYLMFLSFLLFQTVHEARTLMTYIDPCRNFFTSCGERTMIGKAEGVSEELPERSYAEQCELYTGGENCRIWADTTKGELPCFKHLQAAVEDEFFVAHALGWWGKSLIYRHAGFAWLNSIVFEFVEMSFEHWMKNFAECWWDHWILDVMMANAGGIVLGHVFMHYLEVKEYRWMHVSEIPNPIGKVSRVVSQFSPESWDAFNWHPLESPKRLVVMVIVYFMMLVCDFNAFALKYILWIPPRNPLNTARLLLLWAIGMCGSREFYEYTTNPKVKRLGHHAWLASMIIFAEVLLWWKYGRSVGEW